MEYLTYCDLFIFLQPFYFYKPGLIMDNGTCISASDCPCVYHGTAFPVGSTIEQECSNWYVICVSCQLLLCFMENMK